MSLRCELRREEGRVGVGSSQRKKEEGRNSSSHFFRLTTSGSSARFFYFACLDFFASQSDPIWLRYQGLCSTTSHFLLCANLTVPF